MLLNPRNGGEERGLNLAPGLQKEPLIQIAVSTSTGDGVGSICHRQGWQRGDGGTRAGAASHSSQNQVQTATGQKWRH